MQELLISFCFFDSQKLIIYLCISNVFLGLTNARSVIRRLLTGTGGWVSTVEGLGIKVIV